MTDDAAADESSAGPGARARIIAVLRWVLLALVIAAAGYAVYVNWTEVTQTLVEMNPARVALSMVLVLLGIIATTMSWQTLVDSLGHPIGVGRSAQVYLVGMLGKYLPGSVWAYVLQLELGRKAGLARARVFAATVFSLIVATVASLLAGALAVPVLIAGDSELEWLNWLYILLPIGLVMLYPPLMTAIVRVGFKILRRPRPDHPVTLLVVSKALGWALLGYSLYGTHLWLLADTGTGINLGPLALCIGTMGVAMIAGIVAFLLPSGAGARELVIVTALTPVVGAGSAVAFALVSRLMFTIADLGMAGAAALVGVVARRRKGAYRDDILTSSHAGISGDDTGVGREIRSLGDRSRP